MLDRNSFWFYDVQGFIQIHTLKSFCHANNISTRGRLGRDELIDAVLEFSNENKANRRTFFEWYDKISRTGQKHVYLIELVQEIPTDYDTLMANLQNTVEDLTPINYLALDANSLEARELKVLKHAHLCNYKVHKETNNVNSIELNIAYRTLTQKKDEDNATYLIFPFYMKFDFIRKEVEIRLKPVSNMYLYNSKNVAINSDSFSYHKLALAAAAAFKQVFGYSLRNRIDSYKKYIGEMYELLDFYTETPNEIRTLIEQTTTKRDQFISNSFDHGFLDHISWDNEKRNNMMTDLQNVVEKHISINYHNPDIFFSSSDAYPFRISATSEGKMKVDETEKNRNPLQLRPEFYDNKRMLEREKTCNLLGLKYEYPINNNTVRKFDFHLRVIKSSKITYRRIEFSKYTFEDEIERALYEVQHPGVLDLG